MNLKKEMNDRDIFLTNCTYIKRSQLGKYIIKIPLKIITNRDSGKTKGKPHYQWITSRNFSKTTVKKLDTQLIRAPAELAGEFNRHFATIGP